MKSFLKRVRNGARHLRRGLKLDFLTTRNRLAELEDKFARVTASPSSLWLYLNREERMDALDPMFDEARRRFHLARYEFAASHSKSLRIADIACGTGYGCRILSKTGNAHCVVGVDIDQESIQYATEHHGLENVRFLKGDAAATELPNQSFDLVVSFETIEHVVDDYALLQEFFRVLKPQGTLICSTPNEWPLEIASHHVREYSLASFTAALEQFFSVRDMYNQNSGCDSPFNHGQPEGIVRTTPENARCAECYIAVCTKTEHGD